MEGSRRSKEEEVLWRIGLHLKRIQKEERLVVVLAVVIDFCFFINPFELERS